MDHPIVEEIREVIAMENTTDQMRIPIYMYGELEKNRTLAQ
ncbi:MAG: hypothetical protein ACKVOY_11525 [Burkholderiaceae bacterium]